MGGIKHNRWHSNPAVPRAARPEQTSNDAEAWRTWAQQEVQVSCRICGQNIVLDGGSSMGMMAEGGLDAHGTAAEEWKEEVAAGMHKDCFMKYMMIRQMNPNGNNS